MFIKIAMKPIIEKLPCFQPRVRDVGPLPFLQQARMLVSIYLGFASIFAMLTEMEVETLTLNENLLFLRSFIQSPKRVGSLMPSSRFLANTMVKHAPWHEMKAAAELGSGTGAITRQIQARATEATKVFLFEMDAAMRNNLQAEYPRFTCHADATHLVETIQQANVEQLDCIFSGLPFFNFERKLRDALVEQIHSALKPGGQFIAFQYSLQMKKQLTETFVIDKVEFVPLNFPPAFVYVCRKREINELQ